MTFISIIFHSSLSSFSQQFFSCTLQNCITSSFSMMSYHLELRLFTSFTFSANLSITSLSFLECFCSFQRAIFFEYFVSHSPCPDFQRLLFYFSQLHNFNIFQELPASLSFGAVYIITFTVIIERNFLVFTTSVVHVSQDVVFSESFCLSLPNQLFKYFLQNCITSVFSLICFLNSALSILFDWLSSCSLNLTKILCFHNFYHSCNFLWMSIRHSSIVSSL